MPCPCSQFLYNFLTTTLSGGAKKDTNSQSLKSHKSCRCKQEGVQHYFKLTRILDQNLCFQIRLAKVEAEIPLPPFLYEDDRTETRVLPVSSRESLKRGPKLREKSGDKNEPKMLACLWRQAKFLIDPLLAFFNLLLNFCEKVVSVRVNGNRERTELFNL